MTIPTSSNFPDSFDTDTNLYLVHDALRVRLAADYNPGDTSIIVEGDTSVFPSTGLITLTEQQSEPDKRAISFFYNSKTDTTFNGLEILTGFEDVVKLKQITNVTQNVMAEHHNNLKDALIACEEFIGVQGTIDTEPFGNTLEGRINFLRKLVLQPRVWFTADKTIGLAPLDVTFNDLSYRLAEEEGPVIFTWDFGDQTTSNISLISTISAISTVPSGNNNIVVQDLDGGTITKTYDTPGLYDVQLTISNIFGEKSIKFEDFIKVRTEVPDEVQLDFIATGNQIASNGSTVGPDSSLIFDNRLATRPVGPYVTPPTIRSLTNTFIRINVLNNGENPQDLINTYTWSLDDDLDHINASETIASYSIGGIYDVKLRTDTTIGSYRISTYENVIDIIERTNLWLFTQTQTSSSTYTIIGNEFGLLSETFKTANQTPTISKDSSFLNSLSEPYLTQAKQEFERNAIFAKRSSLTSGTIGTTQLFWSGGGSDASTLNSQTLNCLEYEGFSDSYSNKTSEINITRSWNWIFFNLDLKGYFAFGPTNPTAYENHTNQTLTELDYTSGNSAPALVYTTTDYPLSDGSYLNGASELKRHVTSGYDGSGEPENGRYAVYRYTSSETKGYFLRNSGVGAFFRIKNFYETDGIAAQYVMYFRKLTDMPGNREEGQLVYLSSGPFFFNNSGSILAYNESSSTWEVGGPSSGTFSFRNVQDTTISGYDNEDNTLIACSDNETNAYLSYDYSSNAFVKFNLTDLTFTNLGTRPSGTQWMMGIY